MLWTKYRRLILCRAYVSYGVAHRLFWLASSFRLGDLALKIGVSLGISPRESLQHTVEVVKSAEALGFDSAWIADVQLSMKDCYSALTLCALQTSKIKLATGVTNPITRHPTTIASSFTALKELSDDRAIIGIGTGWTAVYSIGEKPSTIKNLERAITDIRAMCNGEEVEGKGGHKYNLTTGTGKIPIYVAANQPRMLALAGRVADGVILMGGANAEFTAWQIEQVRRGAEEVGRSMDDIKLDLWAAIAIADDREEAANEIRHWVASQAETFSKWKSLPEFLKPFEREFAAASAAYDRLEHMSQHAGHVSAVSTDLVEYLSFIGPAEKCLERVKSLEPLGLDRVTLSFRAGGRQQRMEAIHEGIIAPLNAAG